MFRLWEPGVDKGMTRDLHNCPCGWSGNWMVQAVYHKRDCPEFPGYDSLDTDVSSSVSSDGQRSLTDFSEDPDGNVPGETEG